MSDTQESSVITTPDAIQQMVTVRASAEILERAKTKDRPEVDYGTTTKVEITFAFDDPAFHGDEAVLDYVAGLHHQLEDACQGEIRRRKMGARLSESE